MAIVLLGDGRLLAEAATGAALGLALLAAGLWLGRRFSARRRSAEAPSEVLDRAVTVLDRLFDWTARFSCDVSEYRSSVDRLARRVEDAGRSGAAPSKQGAAGGLVHLLQQLSQANERVERRLAAAEKKLQQQAAEIADYASEARTDGLTGLPNRRAFDDELARRLADFRRHGAPLSVLLVDVDHFKRFNDQHGHLIGDAVLRQVAQTLSGALRESDLAARFGGEEFAVVMPHCDARRAAEAAERVRLAVARQRFRAEGRPLQVTISCGAASAQPGDDSHQVLARADEALYAAKQAGRNRAFWHDGRRCRPVAAASAAARTSPSRRAPLKENPEFVAAQAEVRQRLQELIAAHDP